MAGSGRSCELCTGQADFYCPSDSAFLCVTCDRKVHSANFLVARHVRVTLSGNCRTGSPSPLLPAGDARVSCSPLVVAEDEDDDCLSSSSSSCVSSTGEASSSSSMMRRKTTDPPSALRVGADARVEAVLVNWGRKMDLCDGDTSRVVRTAVEILTGCVGKMTVLPFRVLIAAAMWAAIRVCKNSADVARVEQISGVPAKLILATESRVARVIKRCRPREDHVEGWAEC